MNRTIKNSFAMQIARQKDTVATLCIICVLFFAVSGCGKDFDGDTDDDPFYDFFLYSDKGQPYDFYYGDEGKKEILYVRKDKVIIKAESADIAKALCDETVFSSAYDVSYYFVIATINPKKTKLGDIWKIPGVVDATYGLEYADGTFQYPSDHIFMKCKDNTPEEILDAVGLTENVVEIELFDTFSEIYLITLNTRLGAILKTCRNLCESGLCEFAEPSFFREFKL